MTIKPTTVDVLQKNDKFYVSIDSLVLYLEHMMGDSQFDKQAVAINAKELCYALLRLKMEG